MKYRRIIILFLLFIGASTLVLNAKTTRVYAIEDNNSFNEIEETVENQLDNIDFTEFQTVIDNLSSSQKEMFGGENFLSKVKKLISGDISLDFSTITSLIWSLISENIIKFLPLFCIIVGIGILSSIINQTAYGKDKSTNEIIHFVCYSVIIVAVFGVTSQIIKQTSTVLLNLKQQMEISFPILLTLMASLGSVVSVSVYQPAVAILSGSLMGIFSNFILPLFIFCLVFTVVGNLSNNVKLDKFSKLFQNIFKWTIGITFTLFSTFLAVQGITATSYDGFSIRTTKYAMKNYIPFVGSYLSDGLNIILTSSVLIKNAVGMAGFLLLIATVISPILNIIILKLVLSVSASILEPICDKKICNFLSDISKCLSMLIATICVTSFAYLITIALVMCTGNTI